MSEGLGKRANWFVETESQIQMRKRVRQLVDVVVEVVVPVESEMREGLGEMVYDVAEVDSKGKMGDWIGEIVDWAVKCIAEGDLLDGWSDSNGCLQVYELRGLVLLEFESYRTPAGELELK